MKTLALMQVLALSLGMLGALGCGGDDASPAGAGGQADAAAPQEGGDGSTLCTGFADCTGAQQGLICLQGQCTECLKTSECADQMPEGGTIDCVAGRCVACAAGALFNPDAGTCVPLANCKDAAPGSILLQCSEQHRSCDDEAKPVTCGSCLEGYVESVGTCVPATCERNVAASIFDTCKKEQRLCADGPPATCGECIAWYLEEQQGTDKLCRAVKTCDQLNCPNAKRVCNPEQLHQDAACGACIAGYLEQVGTCVAQNNVNCQTPPAAGSILADCQAVYRSCVVNGPSAICGPCISGFVENTVTAICEPVKSCAQTDCAAQFRDCDELPNAHCTDCLPGYGIDTVSGLCVLLKTCAQLTCPTGQACQEATTEDAYSRPDCGATQIWDGSKCIACPSCAGTGQTGNPWPLSTQTGKCICETLPGFFYTDSGDVGTYPCDADNDGWVRVSARVSITNKDLAIRQNARCNLSTIDRFALVNSRGETLEVPVTPPLDLYETDRNDDQGLLDLKLLPKYGVTGRRLKVEELNSLAKYCVKAADFNDNAALDTNEWDKMPLVSSVDPAIAPFTQFSYFAELFRGWYQGPGAGETYGRYFIREKRRSVNAEISVRYEPAEDTVLKTCHQGPDPKYSQSTPSIGMDFQRHLPKGPTLPAPDFGWHIPPGPLTSWFGMNHASQFKCLQLVDPGDPDLNDPDNHPQKRTVEGLKDSDGFLRYQMNTCRTLPQSAGPELPNTKNPSDPSLLCELTPPAAGDVGLATVRFKDYYADADFPRGCLNTCAASRGRCGVCGLGTWECEPGGEPCKYDPTAKRWWNVAAQAMCGELGTTDDCQNIALAPNVQATQLQCDDRAANSSFIYVATSGLDSTTQSVSGSRIHPFKTINYAIGIAKARGSKAVIVGEGTYDEHVVLHNGISIYGGFSGADLDGDGSVDFVRGRQEEFLTIIRPTMPDANKRLIAVNAEGITTATRLDRLTLETADGAPLSSTSTYGIRAHDAAALILADLHVRAGHAGSGQTGIAGASGKAGSVGALGTAGTNSSCPGSEGGNGGLGAQPGAAAHKGALGGDAPGGPSTNPCPTVSGAPAGIYGTLGANGAPGLDGLNGAAATVSGGPQGGYWVGSDGAWGGNGTAAGGGGGGGGKFTTAVGNTCTQADLGGGGGGGGCGGSGGTGGFAGGSSFALFLSNTSGLTIVNCDFHSGNGGNGGAGSTGAPGGDGALGGAQGLPNRGGQGGKGGAGGHGGGGSGGVSYGIFCNGSSLPSLPAVITVGEPGGLGVGPGAPGVGGLAAVSLGCQ